MGNQIPQVGMRNQCVEQRLGLGVICEPKSNQKTPTQPPFIRAQLVNKLFQERLESSTHGS
jgi:hypothetical protein